MLKFFKTKFLFLFLCLSFFVLGGSFFGVEANAQTETQSFNIDSYYDLYKRKEIEAVLVYSNSHLYFYIEKSWWHDRSFQEQNNIKINLFNLGEEFKNKIYPVLTSTFGSEPKPGIDGDEKITVLIHQMTGDAAGYFNPGDLYEKLQYPKSNQREMVYLSSQHINQPNAKSFLAHEFMHLITANQKDLLRNVTEEIWLNEARAEFAPTLLGYDDIYKGSNLERRVRDFLSKPSDSLTGWLNRKEDYGAVNLFTQYLVDHYDGAKILVDSLKTNKTGIESINYALQKNNYNKNFSQIFADWAIAVLVNDCQLGSKYCYLNENLKSITITPTFYYLPKAETTLSAYHNITYWSANWYKFVGGEENLFLEFNGTDLVDFKVPYLLCDPKDNCSVDFFVLDNNQKGEIFVSEFGAEYSSLTIMPFIKSKKTGFNGQEDYFSFALKVLTQKEQDKKRDKELVSQLLSQIEELKKEIAYYQAKINAILHQQGAAPCRVDNNLYFGVKNSAEVTCLQQFLKAQGPQIYPEGLVTGNFLSLTQQAVVRFQEKYAQEILYPLNLQKGTGYVGPATRIKINQLINF